MKGFEIRSAIWEDAEAILYIERLCFSDPWSMDIFLETISNPQYINLVVTQKVTRQIVGYICLAVIADEGHIDNVLVSPKYRREGIGEGLLKAAMRRADERGACDYTLEVRVGNTAARMLYEKAGFTCEGIRRNYYGSPTEDAAIYWKYKESL